MNCGKIFNFLECTLLNINVMSKTYKTIKYVSANYLLNTNILNVFRKVYDFLLNKKIPFDMNNSRKGSIFSFFFIPGILRLYKNYT